MLSGSMDEEHCMLHDGKDGDLLVLMTKHVDDSKVTGVRFTVVWVCNEIQEVSEQF